MCTFGLSGCRVKPRWLWGIRGFTRQPENSQRAHFRPPALQTPPKFNERTSKRGRKNENCGGRGKKRAKCWAVFGGWSGVCVPEGWVLPLPGFGGSGLNVCLQLAKVGLAKVGHDRAELADARTTVPPLPNHLPEDFVPNTVGCIVDAMQAARHGVPKGMFPGWRMSSPRRKSVASVDTTTLVSGEHGELSHVSEVAPRIRILCGLRGRRGKQSRPRQQAATDAKIASSPTGRGQRFRV